jgi:glutamate-1-semialdehyde 2,1-aminomutase
VITGFRVARGGAQEREGVTPDLTVLGKVIGGGLPAAAYAGRRDLMELVAPAGEVYQAGTLSGNPLATAAGLATLRLLDEAAYRRLGELASGLAEGLEAAAGEAGIEACAVAEPGLLTLFFAPEPPRGYEEAKACDLDAHAAFCRGMLDRGVYLPPSQFEAWFLSSAHGDAEIDATIDAARESFASV